MFKDRLRELRIKKGLTQEELADIIHVSRSAICKWEMGNGIPSDPNVEGLCEFFNVSEEWLLDRNDLKDYIIKESKIRKNYIVSIIGLILPFVLIIFTFVGFFVQLYNGPNLDYLLWYIPPRSIYYYLGPGVIIPIIVYGITLAISFVNILQVVKEGLIKKMLIADIILIVVSITLYLASFVIALILANDTGFGIRF